LCGNLEKIYYIEVVMCSNPSPAYFASKTLIASAKEYVKAYKTRDPAFMKQAEIDVIRSLNDYAWAKLALDEPDNNDSK
jgi:hypothetical protein